MKKETNAMSTAHEEDVVIAFRQALEEELQLVQNGQSHLHEDVFEGGASAEEAVHRLAERTRHLEREVALLRTIVLRLVSDPVDQNDQP